MANVNMPKGFSPVGSLTGANWNQQGRLYAIANDASNTYAIGDVVKTAGNCDADGIPLVTKWLGTNGATDIPLGIIVGIRVADPTVSLVGTNLDLTKTWIPLSAGITRYVYVVDDPHIIFTAQFDVTGVTAAQVHRNCGATVVQDQTSSLAVSSPFSSIVLTGPATTNTLPIRLLGLLQTPTSIGQFGAYANVLAKFNNHEFGVGTGTNFQGV